jgi:hypothetical protein
MERRASNRNNRAAEPNQSLIVRVERFDPFPMRDWRDDLRLLFLNSLIDQSTMCSGKI